MGEPARKSDGGHGPDDPAAGEPGPGEAGVRRALVTGARAVRLAVEELARRPGDPAALEMARLTLSVLEHLGEEARGRMVGEAGLEAEHARGFEEGWQACLAARRRMGVIGGGRAG